MSLAAASSPSRQTTSTTVRLPPLHDVRDPEALCQSVLRSVLGKNGGHWSAEDREEILNDLRFLILRLAERWDPNRSRRMRTFSTYATWILRRRAGVDAYRQRLVDTRYHERRVPNLSLDELLEQLDRSVEFEENDEVRDREQSDLLTRLAIVTATSDRDPEEALGNWLAQLTPEPEPDVLELIHDATPSEAAA